MCASWLPGLHTRTDAFHGLCCRWNETFGLAYDLGSSASRELVVQVYHRQGRFQADQLLGEGAIRLDVEKTGDALKARGTGGGSWEGERLAGWLAGLLA